MKKKIELSTDQRPFSMIYHDFFKCDFLDAYEKIVFIALKVFSDENNQCFPSVKTLAKTTCLSEKKVKTTLKKLEDKNIVIKKNQFRIDGGKTNNLYTLLDFRETWTCDSTDEITDVINTFEESQMIKALLEKGYEVIKKREPETLSTSQIVNVSGTLENNFHNQNTTQTIKSQERYTLDQIKQLFEYDIMLQDNSNLRKDIDSVIDILHTALNTTKQTIKIAGENKPSMIVISKLMKLNKESIVYSINKFLQQSERIKNPTSYMLTILYNAPEQFNLDLQNQIQHNFTVVK